MANDKIAVFLYLDGDNDLERGVVSDLLNYLNADLSEKMDIFVYLDRQADYDENSKDYKILKDFDEKYDDWRVDGEVQNGTRVGKIYRREDGEFDIDWELLEDEDSWNSADPETLYTFMEWAVPQTDASHYIVSVNDHGCGVEGCMEDDTCGGGMMLPSQIAQALEPYKDNLDLVIFDACLMASAEVFSSMQGIAKYMIASEDITYSNETPEEEGSTFGIHHILAGLPKLESVTAESIMEYVLDMSKNRANVPTVTAADLSVDLTSAMNDFAKAAMNCAEDDWPRLIQAFKNPDAFFDFLTNAADLRTILRSDCLAEGRISNALRKAIDDLLTVLDSAIVGTAHHYWNGSGLTIYNPLLSNSYEPPERTGQPAEDYACFNMTPLGNDSDWSKFIRELYSNAYDTGYISGRFPDDYILVDGRYSPLDNIVMKGLPEYNQEMFIIKDMREFGLISGGGLTYDGLYSTTPLTPIWLAFFFRDSAPENAYFTITPQVLGDYTLQEDAIKATLYPSIFFNEVIYNGDGTPFFNYVVDIDNPIVSVSYPSESDVLTLPVAELPQDVVFLCIESCYPVNYVMTYTNDEYIAEEDRFEENSVKKEAVKLEEYEYYPAMLVNATSEGKEDLDWFLTKRPLTITIKVLGRTDGLQVDEDTLTVQAFDNETGELSAVAQFDDEELTYSIDVPGKEYLSITTSSEGNVYYTIETALWKDGYTDEYVIDGDEDDGEEDDEDGKVKAMDADDEDEEEITQSVSINAVASAKIPGLSNSHCLYWNVDSLWGVTDTSLQFSLDEEFSYTLNFNSKIGVAKVYQAPENLIWRVDVGECDDDTPMEELDYEAPTESSLLIESQHDGIADLFFARSTGIWDGRYIAKHMGDGKWEGTGEEFTALAGKNRITDIFDSNGDKNVLILSDDAQGDALFLDDIYSDFPTDVQCQSRLRKISQILCGDGDDIVDLTSDQFTTDTKVMTIRGGDGDDTIWASAAQNVLFGDAGNDRIVGGSANDIISGGSGDDSIHGGGGVDFICFGKDWGHDTVEQVDGSHLVLWFDTGITLEPWNEADSVIYAGDSSVTLLNDLAIKDVTVVLGDELLCAPNQAIKAAIEDKLDYYLVSYDSLGAFDDFTHDMIFTSSNTPAIALA